MGDYKLIIGLQSLSFHQGPDYPNGTKGVPYTGFNFSLDCGNNVNMEGGVRWRRFLDLSRCPSANPKASLSQCLFNVRSAHASSVQC